MPELSNCSDHVLKLSDFFSKKNSGNQLNYWGKKSFLAY
jgi:hypothetical protein